jgi:predicted AlkP superfamily pyrophosphatase or phosphodiesterase
VTAQKFGHKAGVYFWPGSEAQIKGRRPNYWFNYSVSVPNAQRVDTLLSWMDMPIANRPSLLMLYMSDVDVAGHKYGPASDKEISAAIQQVDNAIGRLVR